jgi:large conductance mechanosensitive channel
MMMGGVDFSNIFVTLKDGATAGPYASLAGAQAAGAVTMNVGMFLNKVISFIIVAFSVFMLVKAMNKAKREEPKPAPAAPTTKECPFCLSTIPLKATRCAHCASDLK